MCYLPGVKKLLLALKILLTSIHPIVFILAVCSFRRHWKESLRNSIFRLITIYAIIIIFIRVLKFIKQGFMPDRYLLLLIIIFSIFAADGFFRLAICAHSKYLKSFKTDQLKRFAFVFAFILLLIMLGKALSPHLDKPWYNELALVSANTDHNKNPVLLSNEPDSRIAFYMNSRTYLIDTKSLKISESSFKLWNGQFSSVSPKTDCQFLDFYNSFSHSQSPVFMILFDFDPTAAEKLFRDRGLNFNFRLIKSLQDTRKKYVISIFKMMGT